MLLMAAASLAFPRPSAAAESIVPPEPLTRVTPERPKSEGAEVIGEALIECTIGEDGTIAEAAVKSATRPELGEAALVALRQWTFKPGTRDGHAAPMRIQVPFAFRSSLEARIEAFVKRAVFVTLTEPVVSAEQLGVWPNAKQLMEARYPEELKGSGKRGKAVVAVVVDRQGKVINPKVIKATYPEFALPALVTAAAMDFEPVKGKDGKPMLVSMQLQFDFREDTKKAKGDAKSKPKAKKQAAPAEAGAQSE